MSFNANFVFIRECYFKINYPLDIFNYTTHADAVYMEVHYTYSFCCEVFPNTSTYALLQCTSPSLLMDFYTRCLLKAVIINFY